MNIFLTILLPAGTSILLLAFALKLFLTKERLKTALDKSRQDVRRLRNDAENYRLLAENISEVIFILDITSLRYTYVSPSIFRTYGYTPEEAVSLTLDKHITPASLDMVFKTIAQELGRDGQPGVDPNRYITLETEQYRKDGSTLWVETIAKPMRDENGQINTVVGAARDITDRKKAETALRKSNKLHRMLAENINDVIYMVDITTLRYTYVSPSVIRTHGFTPEELTRLSIEQVLTPASFGNAVTTLTEELEKDKQPGMDPNRYLTLEMEQYRKDGSIMLVETVNKFLRDEDGTPVSIVGVARDIRERKKAETTLRESESLYRLLADNITEVISLLDIATMQYTYISPSVSKLFSYTPKERLPLPLNERMTSETVEIIFKTLKEELERDDQPGMDPDRHVIIETEVYHKDGSTIPMETVARFLRDEAGKPLSILGVSRDIRERKKAETALRESEERYRMLADNINEIIFIIELETFKHTYASPSAKNILGYTPEEMLSLPIDKLLTPESLERTAKTLAEAFVWEPRSDSEPDKNVILELEVYHKNGSTLWVETSAKALRDNSGKPLSVLGVTRDITERKKAETALRESEERYRMLAENISEIIYLFDPKTLRHTFITPSIFQLFGYTPEEYLELPFDKILTPMSFEVALKAIGEELARGKEPGSEPLEYITLELEAYRKDGSTLWVETTGRVFFDDNGNPMYLLGVGRDLSQRKAAQDALKQAKEAAEAANRAKSEFLANMSHEIRTPMNGILGMTELLLDTTLSAEQCEFAEIVKNSAESLLVILNDVLDFSKIEAGMLKLEIIDFDLRTLCKTVHDTIQPRAGQKHVGYNTVIKEDVPILLQGDPVRLRQVLMNLCENAVKFTDRGSVTVTISLNSQTDTTVTLLFAVADSGIGIPQESLDQIFDSFSQVDASTTRRYGGTGLGLAITKRIVSLMGGEISVTSEPGRGTTFRFAVTFEKQDRRSRAPAIVQKKPSSKPAGEMDALNILVVEDNPISCKVLEEMLGKMGHSVTLAINGAEAVDTFGRQAFDLVLMDIQMPVMDGITATKKIHAIQRKSKRKIPVIAITANAMVGDRERFLRQGLNDYIAKPFKMETLINVIQRNIA